jgi:hypothetical protein
MGATQFTCLDGSETLAIDKVNDDYCDCRDGSDEPGTGEGAFPRVLCVRSRVTPRSCLPQRRILLHQSWVPRKDCIVVCGQRRGLRLVRSD